MVDRYLSPKFGVNSFSGHGIRENDVARRTDSRVTTVALLCYSTKQR